ncbi:terminase large subunit [Ignatzschineria sp. F8392]|uniref:terminase large subunit n=1 Tax=Ignatzschineria sp. F8392 TaxID=1980117 RepID=UPI001E644C4F|nr:terminase TerL endonuclease subunit [Ignatzschineria sp. F8392]
MIEPRYIELPVHIIRAIKSGPVPKVRNWRELEFHQLTRAERMCAFIENHCVVPEGKLAGQPAKLALFQEAFIYAVYDNPHQTTEAILSIARKNGKTGLIAFLMLGHIVGPESKLNSRVISGAMSREQASEVYRAASNSAELSDDLRSLVRATPSQKTLLGLAVNAEYKAISAEGKTAHGNNPVLTIIDEAGQIKGSTSEFIEAITTAGGAYDDPLRITISTQSETDHDYFSLDIDDAIEHQPADKVCHLYEAEKDCDLLDEKQWLYANPALGEFKDINYLRAEADKATRSPRLANTFRRYQLNQRIVSNEAYIQADEWKLCNGKPAMLDKEMQIFGGLDLSKTTDLTSLVLIGIDSVDSDHAVHVHPYFWMPNEKIEERDKTDRAPYIFWRDEGYIKTTPGATVDYDFVAYQLIEILEDHGLWFTDLKIGFDRWKIGELKKSLLALNVPESDINQCFIEHGQGFKDMTPALEKLTEYILNHQLRHGDNPVLNMCSFNAIAVEDPAENVKLDKRRATGRIDGVQALAMAVGTSLKEPNEAPKEPSLFFI